MTNAMLPPAVTTMRRSEPTSMPFSAASLRRDRLDEPRLALDRPVAVISGVRGNDASDGQGLGGRAVGDDPLAERDGSRVPPNQVGDDRDDWSLHSRDALRVSHSGIQPLRRFAGRHLSIFTDWLTRWNVSR